MSSGRPYMLRGKRDNSKLIPATHVHKEMMQHVPARAEESQVRAGHRVCLETSACALTVPPMRKSSPATYCMRSCCWQHPNTPMIHPKRMMDTAMPTKPAVILLRSANEAHRVPPPIRKYEKKERQRPYLNPISLHQYIKYWCSGKDEVKDELPMTRLLRVRAFLEHTSSCLSSI